MNGLLDHEVAVIEPNLTPLTFSLSAYPNPFNAFTVISIVLPLAGNVDLRIHDAVGRQVAVLTANQRLSQGTYRFPWNVSGLPAGTYFLRLTGSTFVQTKTLTLSK